MWMLGLGGYVYAGDDTAGNVLLNVPMSKEGVNASDYYLFLLGRIGCGITILVAMPMNLLPCRESLLEVIDINFHRTHHRTDHEREKCCWTLFHRLNSYESVQDADITTEDEVLEMSVEGHHLSSEHPEDCDNLHTSVLIRQEPIQSDYVFRNAVSTSSGLLCHYSQHSFAHPSDSSHIMGAPSSLPVQATWVRWPSAEWRSYGASLGAAWPSSSRLCCRARPSLW